MQFTAALGADDEQTSPNNIRSLWSNTISVLIFVTQLFLYLLHYTSKRKSLLCMLCYVLCTGSVN